MIPKKLNSTVQIDRLYNHFKNDIKDDDRRLRFGSAVDDIVIEKYLNKSEEEYGYKNMWFIIEVESPDCFDKKIVATCHVAYDRHTNTAELGLTVSPDYRNQKIGQELYNRGATWARMRGAETIFMHCLSENKAIQHIARKSGMTVVTYDMGEKQGSVVVTKNPVVSQWEDTVWDNMAVYDEAIRKQKWFFKNFMKAFGVK